LQFHRPHAQLNEQSGSLIPEVIPDASGLKSEPSEAEVKRFARASPKTGQRPSLRKIAAELEKLGHVKINGRSYSANSVGSMIEGSAPDRPERQEADPT
jgi:hypothetical protein